MASLKPSRALAVLALALALGACTDDDGPKGLTPADGGGAGPVTGILDGGAGDGGVPSPLAACVERPTNAPSVATGALPCELLPPGFAAR